MPLKIYTSNRMETLVDQLAAVVGKPLPSPFTPETIVVQSKGMQRWLAMELARRFGVWANGEFPFPNAVVEALFRSAIPDLAETPQVSSFHPDVLTWRLMELLPASLGCPGFEPLAGYLADAGDGLKRLQLAEKIADTFDQYTIYRPELLLSWEEGAEGGWQALLWRELVRNATDRHRAALLAEFRRRINRPDAAAAELPGRVSLIGIPTLPPFHMEVLAGIARQTEINLFLLNPCREYWGKIVSERELARLERRELDEDPLHGYFETGNPLLASMGGIGRDFFDSLIGDCGDAEFSDTFTEIRGSGLLHAIQADILDLRDRGAAGNRGIISPTDDTLRIHSCHSAMREIEVLYDQLLSLFDDDPTLSPRDILVMTPDIEAYAPYISAVFGTPERPEQRIPYSIADRSLRREGETAEVLLAILQLCGSRFAITEVLDILEAAPVCRCFGLTDKDLETVRQWLTATNIRWGIDATERAGHGVPAFSENSWRSGLDRLLLGYAMAGEDRHFFGGILPYDHLEGSDALLLGRFMEFCGTLFSRVQALARPRQIEEWTAELRSLLATFIKAEGDDERDAATILKVIEHLDECQAHANFGGDVGIEAVRAWLGEKLGSEQRGFGFLTGGVTFCAMLPMRSIPFRVIALLGMNDGVFPRRNRPHGFDLIAASPRRGDRSQRDEDRYLFLEALLSARERFSISYVGQNIKDNSELPPSVLVSELLDYIAKGFTRADEEADETAAVRGICVRHPLQPFSRDYFRPDDERLFSYSRENLHGVVAAIASRAVPATFLSRPLPPAEETLVTLYDLAEFFANPCKHFLRRRLGIYLEQRDESFAECEPFSLDHLGKYTLGQEIVATLIKGENLDNHRAVARSRGELPPGECGTITYDTLASAASDFAGQVAAATFGTPLPPLEIDLEFKESRLVGRIERIWPEGLVHYRYAKLKAKDRLRIWIEHLCLSSAAPAGYPPTAILLACDATVAIAPVPDSLAILEQLLAIYRRGMSAPLPFFPESALEYARKANDPKKAAKALGDARKKWHGSEDYPGEKGDPYYQRCFGDEEPLGEEFMALSRMVYDPLLAHSSEKKVKREEKEAA